MKASDSLVKPCCCDGRSVWISIVLLKYARREPFRIVAAQAVGTSGVRDAGF